MTEVETERSAYDAARAQDRWQQFWETDQTFRPLDDGSRERRYVLDMFPYPSGDLHMGHAEAFVMADVVARHWKLKGYDVLHPIGWDSFGLPAENAAIKRNAHPAEWTYANIETQANSFKRYGLSFDWSRRLHTSDPEYYRWTQWLFLRFFERGLAYRKASFVNWCPTDQTVLANEQVVQGLCERCGSVVTKRQADPVVLQDHRLRRAPAGRHGAAGGRLARAGADHAAQLDRPVRGRVRRLRHRRARGAGHRLHDPAGHPVRGHVLRRRARGAAGRGDRHRGAAAGVRGLPGADQAGHRDRAPVDRPAQDRGLPGRHATNPVNGEQIPVYAADYVLAEYGTGAVMAVPAHDQRDLDFARTYDLPVRVVVDTGAADPERDRGGDLG